MLDASSPGDGERKAKAAAMSNPLFIRSIHCWVENVKWRRYLGCPASLRQPRYCPSVTEGMKHALQDPPLVSQDVEPCRGNSRCPTVLENTRSVSRRHQSWGGVCMCTCACRRTTCMQLGEHRRRQNFVLLSPYLILRPRLAGVCYCVGLSRKV